MMTDTIAYEAFRSALNSLRPGWVASLEGLRGPDGALVRLLQEHESNSPGHVDVLFVLDDRAERRVEFRDCVVGFGETHPERAQIAAHLWSQTTAPALIELKYSQRGEYADHFHAEERAGLPGWHVICGPVLGFGEADSPDRLQAWLLENPVLPILAPALLNSLDEPSCPHGIKIFFGGSDVAEIRLNGVEHPAASAALAQLPWPRLTPAAFVRSYAILLHPE